VSTDIPSLAESAFDNTPYRVLKTHSVGYYLLLGLSLFLTGAGVYSALTIEHEGHQITGMNNHIVWGLPHVFAIGLIVAASGALNGATFSSVFGISVYKPYARFSVVLASCLLIGGLVVLVLDLGRPDRLIVAMTTYNFRSIFTWNIFLYSGFVVIGVVYLWMMMDRRNNIHVKRVGTVAFLWRIVLTTGTGCIFGFLVGRNALDSAIYAPLFIAVSLSLGTAVYAIGLSVVTRWSGQRLPDSVVSSLERFLFWFLIVLLYFSVVHHLTNLYVAEHQASEKFTLNGPLSLNFWIGHIVIGTLVPLGLVLFGRKFVQPEKRLLGVSALALIGGWSLLYVVVVGSQSTPQRLFPGHTVVSSSFGDAGFESYQASGWEWMLGFGGAALAVLICLMVLRILPLVPESAVTHADTLDKA